MYFCESCPDVDAGQAERRMWLDVWFEARYFCLSCALRRYLSLRKFKHEQHVKYTWEKI